MQILERLIHQDGRSANLIAGQIHQKMLILRCNRSLLLINLLGFNVKKIQKGLLCSIFAIHPLLGFVSMLSSLKLHVTGII